MHHITETFIIELCGLSDPFVNFVVRKINHYEHNSLLMQHDNGRSFYIYLIRFNHCNENFYFCGFIIQSCSTHQLINY